MMIKRIKSGSPFEEKIGYCRAVVAGGFVHVAGTVAAGPDVPTNVVDQCQSALDIIENALKESGTSFEKIVRVNYYLPEIKDFEACWPLLAKSFGDNPPAATVVESNLIDPKYLIEIEVTALA